MTTTSPPKPTWNKRDTEAAIDIYVEGPDGGYPVLVVTRAPRAKLFRRAPALQDFVVDDSQDKILLPGPSYGVDDDKVHSVIGALLESTDGRLLLTIDQNAREFLQTHVVLALCGLHRDAKMMEDQIWNRVQQELLTLEVIQWVWETFGGFVAMLRAQTAAGSYIPPYCELYLQATLWQLVNLSVEGKLYAHIKEWIMKLSPSYFGLSLEELIDERYKLHGVEPGFTISETFAKLDRTLCLPAATGAGGGSFSVTEMSDEKAAILEKPPTEMNFDRAGAKLHADPKQWARQQAFSKGHPNDKEYGSDTESGKFDPFQFGRISANKTDVDSGANYTFGPRPATLKPLNSKELDTKPTTSSPALFHQTNALNPEPSATALNFGGMEAKFDGVPATPSGNPGHPKFGNLHNANALSHQPSAQASKPANVGFGFGGPVLSGASTQQPNMFSLASKAPNAGVGFGFGFGGPMTSPAPQRTTPHNPFASVGTSNASPFAASPAQPNFGQSPQPSAFTHSPLPVNPTNNAAHTPNFPGTQTWGLGGQHDAQNATPRQFGAGAGPGVFGQAGTNTSNGPARVFGQANAQNSFNQTGAHTQNGPTSIDTSFGQTQGNAFGNNFQANFGGNGQANTFGANANTGINPRAGPSGGAGGNMFAFQSNSGQGAAQPSGYRQIRTPKSRMQKKR